MDEHAPASLPDLHEEWSGASSAKIYIYIRERQTDGTDTTDRLSRQTFEDRRRTDTAQRALPKCFSKEPRERERRDAAFQRETTPRFITVSRDLHISFVTKQRRYVSSVRYSGTKSIESIVPTLYKSTMVSSVGSPQHAHSGTSLTRKPVSQPAFPTTHTHKGRIQRSYNRELRRRREETRSIASSTS